jgi:hypothetical protein
MPDDQTRDLAAEALDEVQTDDINPATSSPSQLAEALNHLQAVIERNVEQLDNINEELSIEGNTLKNILDNDAEMASSQEQAEELTNKVKQRRTQLMASPEVAQAKTKMAELKEQRDEIQEALNTHLLNLYKITGQKIIDFSTGEQREFKIRASVGRSKKAA